MGHEKKIESLKKKLFFTDSPRGVCPSSPSPRGKGRKGRPVLDWMSLARLPHENTVLKVGFLYGVSLAHVNLWGPGGARRTRANAPARFPRRANTSSRDALCRSGGRVGRGRAHRQRSTLCLPFLLPTRVFFLGSSGVFCTFAQCVSEQSTVTICAFVLALKPMFTF